MLKGLLRVSLKHLDKVLATGSMLEGQTCHTAQINCVVLVVRVQSGCTVSPLGSRKRNKDAVTSDTFLDLYPESRISTVSVC